MSFLAFSETFPFVSHPGVAAASTVGGVKFLSVHQLAVAAHWHQCCTTLFQVLLVQMTALASHSCTMGRLLGVSPDMAKFLTAVTLHVTSLDFVWLHPDCNMARAYQFEYLLGLWHPR
jgi:hypothetical protein